MRRMGKKKGVFPGGERMGRNCAPSPNPHKSQRSLLCGGGGAPGLSAEEECRLPIKMVGNGNLGRGLPG